MTEEEKRERQRDAQLCDALSIPYQTIWILTTDGGKSAYYSSEFRADCVQFLDDVKKRYPNGWQAKGEVSSWKRYPPISTDWGAMKLVIDAMKRRPDFLHVDTQEVKLRDGTFECWAWFVLDGANDEATATTIPVAVREAACKTLGLPPLP